VIWRVYKRQGDGLGDERNLVPHLVESSSHIICFQEESCLFLSLVCLMIVGLEFRACVMILENIMFMINYARYC